MDALDSSLDALVQRNKVSFRGGWRSRGRGGIRGGRPPLNRFLGPRSTTVFRRSTRFRNGFGANTDKPNRGAQWQTEGARLFVSNLDNGVSNEDIRELFSHVGELKYCSIHYDKSGRSKGTAEVCYARKDRAALAIEQYNRVHLDGKPMMIELIGGTPATNGLTRPIISRAPKSFAFTGGRGIRKPRGAATRGRGWGRGRGQRGGQAQAPAKTVEELNADLDKYHSQSQAMEM